MPKPPFHRVATFDDKYGNLSQNFDQIAAIKARARDRGRSSSMLVSIKMHAAVATVEASFPMRVVASESKQANRSRVQLKFSRLN